MPERSFYEILGVSPTDSDKAIRKSYLKLSRKWHPAVNPGDNAALTHYDDVCRAFEVIGERAKRREYDRLGHEGYIRQFVALKDEVTAPESVPREIDRNGFIGRIFGLDREKAPAAGARGEDIQQYLTVPFLAAMQGTTAEIKIKRKVRCQVCRGSGAAPGSKTEPCPECGGAGRQPVIKGGLTFDVACSACQALGVVIHQTCASCRGGGRELKEESVAVFVPPGAGGGAEIKVPRKGHEGPAGSRTGDLKVILKVIEHPGFQRKGANILSRAEVPVWRAAMGGAITVQTLIGEAEIAIPAGTQEGDQIRLPSRGAPIGKGGRRGDHVFEIHIQVPQPSTEAQKEAYLNLARAFSEKAT